ncbi:MAG: peptidoglycan-binding domain-containing protein [Pseudomonadota bacterium]
MSLQDELEEVKAELATLEHSLTVLRDAALLDGVIDDEEQKAIDDLDGAIRLAKDERDLIARDLAAQSEADDGGFFGGLKDMVGDALDAAGEALGIGDDDDGSDSDGGRVGSNIFASVGKGGKNGKDDTKTVQTLLNAKGASLTVDGLIGPKTIGAIESFQQRACPPATGLVSPRDATMAALLGAGQAAASEDAEPVEDGGLLSGVFDAVEDVVTGVGDALEDVFGITGEEYLEALATEFEELEEEAEKL